MAATDLIVADIQPNNFIFITNMMYNIYNIGPNAELVRTLKTAMYSYWWFCLEMSIGIGRNVDLL
jgi:hypothetical protein